MSENLSRIESMTLQLRLEVVVENVEFITEDLLEQGFSKNDILNFLIDKIEGSIYPSLSRSKR